ncbi:glycosyltransferase [Kaarinaea lacus]
MSKDLINTEALIGTHNYRYFQSPVHFSQAAKPTAAYRYSELLLNCGLHNKQSLLARLKAWRNLFVLLQAELIVIDHSPTALLASRSLGIPTVLFGTGFFAPPHVSPMPSLRPWLKIPEKSLIDSEQRVLNIINEALKSLHVSTLNQLHDMFNVMENFLCTFKELDHYPQRENAVYWGPRFSSEGGTQVQWPRGATRKVFAYLYASYPHLEMVLDALKANENSIVVHCSGISMSLVRKYSAANLEFIAQPADQKQIAKECDLVICHAGHGMVSAMLLAGCPILLLPMHLEQMLLAHNVANLKAGIMILPEQAKPNFKKAIKTLLSESSFKQAAQTFAKKHKEFNANERNQAIVKRCLEILPKLHHQ